MIAKRGDLCAVSSTTRDYTIGGGSAGESTRVALAVVAGITRDGVVRSVFTVWDGSGASETRTTLRPFDSVRVIPRDTIDAAGAVSAYAARRYPTAPHSSMVPPCSSLDELRDVLRPHLIGS